MKNRKNKKAIDIKQFLKNMLKCKSLKLAKEQIFHRINSQSILLFGIRKFNNGLRENGFVLARHKAGSH